MLTTTLQNIKTDFITDCLKHEYRCRFNGWELTIFPVDNDEKLYIGGISTDKAFVFYNTWDIEDLWNYTFLQLENKMMHEIIYDMQPTADYVEELI